MNIGNSVKLEVERSVSAEVGRGYNVGVESDVGVEVGSGDGD